MATEKTDVVIVGVGAVGGIIAAELGKAGMKVIGLERGPRLKTSDFEPHDELRYFERQDLRPNPKRDPVTWRPNANAQAHPMPSLNNGNQAGGGTVHYGTLSWRMHEDDFRVRTKTIERYGASAIPDDSSLTDWPVSYAELEPFYDQAEYELGVSGKAGNLQGKKIEGGNVFEAPRKREYPLKPLLVDQSAILYEAGAKKLGLHPFSSPRAIVSEPYNGRPGCTYCGFCQAFGCHVGAKSSILVTKLPEADATGNFKLITGAMCHRVNSDNSGKVTGVSYYGPDRSDNTIEADIVIVAPFIYDNTRLMLLSKTEKFPNGLANSSGHLGKHVMAHIMAKVFVTFDDRYVNNFMGPSAQKHTVDDFNADNFDHSGLGFIRGAQFSIGTPNLQGGPIAFSTDRHAAGHAELGRGLSRFRRQVLRAPRRHGRADRKSAVRGPDHRSRSERARRLGPAGAARHLRLAAAERARPRRVRAEETGRDRPRDGRTTGLAGAGQPGGCSRRAPRRRHAHGKRSARLGRQQIRPDLGSSQSVPDRQLDVPDHGSGLQSDADDSGARLHVGGRDREPLPEKSGTADLTG